MKGTILICLRDLLQEEKGMSQTQWQGILQAAGLSKHAIILMLTDIEDTTAINLFMEAQKLFYKDFLELADAYGNYWSVTYASKVYQPIYKGVKNSREFLLKMDKVHVMVTQTMENARPPRFIFEEVGTNEVIVHYRSQRGLIYLFAGLARGLGNYFKEKLDVSVISDEKVSIKFPV